MHGVNDRRRSCYLLSDATSMFIYYVCIDQVKIDWMKEFKTELKIISFPSTIDIPSASYNELFFRFTHTKRPLAKVWWRKSRSHVTKRIFLAFHRRSTPPQDAYQRGKGTNKFHDFLAKKERQRSIPVRQTRKRRSRARRQRFTPGTVLRSSSGRSSHFN